VVVCGYEERDCEVLRVVDPKRFFLSVDDDTEFIVARPGSRATHAQTANGRGAGSSRTERGPTAAVVELGRAYRPAGLEEQGRGEEIVEI
jgi:hypothetical protein